MHHHSTGIELIRQVSHIRNTAGSEISSVWSAHAQRDSRPLLCGRPWEKKTVAVEEK